MALSKMKGCRLQIITRIYLPEVMAEPDASGCVKCTVQVLGVSAGLLADQRARLFTIAAGSTALTKVCNIGAVARVAPGHWLWLNDDLWTGQRAEHGWRGTFCLGCLQSAASHSWYVVCGLWMTLPAKRHRAK